MPVAVVHDWVEAETEWSGSVASPLDLTIYELHNYLEV
jgi:hypothetical protein